jgi:hypothetical protein
LLIVPRHSVWLAYLRIPILTIARTRPVWSRRRTVMMMSVEHPEEHDKLADQMQQEGDEMKQRSAELGDEISDVRDDWQRKRADEGVPGAPPPEESDESEDSENSENSKED